MRIDIHYLYLGTSITSKPGDVQDFTSGHGDLLGRPHYRVFRLPIPEQKLPKNASLKKSSQKPWAPLGSEMHAVI